MTIEFSNGAQPQVPAGWHPDPEVPGQNRYWDGRAWTDHTAPAAQPAPVAPAAAAAPAAPVAASYVAPRGPNGEELASIGARFGARIADVVILWMLSAVISLVGLTRFVGDDAGLGSLAGLVALFAGMAIAGLLYEIFMIATRGQTLGKMLCGVKIVSAKDGQLPSFGSAVMRWLLPGVMFLIPVFGWLLGVLTWLSPLFDDRRRGWHDKAGDTIAVRAKALANL